MRLCRLAVPRGPSALVKARAQFDKAKIMEAMAAELENLARQKMSEAREATKKAKKDLADATIEAALAV